MSDVDQYFRLVQSPQNETVKQLKIHLEGGSVANKLRAESHRAVIEGIHLLSSWLDAGQFEQITKLVTTTQSLEIPEVSSLVLRLIAHVQENDLPFPEMIILEEKIAKSISSFGYGPVLICEILIPQHVFEFNSDHDHLVLDCIQDAGNVGTMLRTAAAAGLKYVFCTVGTAQVWSSKVLRAGMGAHTHLQIVEGVLPTDFANCKQPIFVTALESKAASLYSLSEALKNPHTWIFGNEGKGVASAFFEQGESVYIPQAPSVESLNVASACSVCLFEVRRVRLFN
jgi:RNA methyltransferase, TrmH family